MLPQLTQLEKQFSPSILTKLDDPWLHQHKIEILIKRDDLLHPIISGNKWRKLKYSLNDALVRGAHTLISMGGAYSNHLHALAYAGNKLGLQTVGFIRGEQPANLNPTLTNITSWGMQLKFVSRSAYRELRQYKNGRPLLSLNAGEYWLPEGGATPLAMAGVGELVKELGCCYDVICVPCGTGATLAGIIRADNVRGNILGFAVLKGAGFMNAEVNEFLANAASTEETTDNAWPSQAQANWSINLDYHFGGFAKHNAELSDFIASFNRLTGIPLERVYSGKMLYGIYDLIKRGYFKPGQRIVAVHTGGLQGSRS